MSRTSYFLFSIFRIIEALQQDQKLFSLIMGDDLGDEWEADGLGSGNEEEYSSAGAHLGFLRDISYFTTTTIKSSTQGKAFEKRRGAI